MIRRSSAPGNSNGDRRDQVDGHSAKEGRNQGKQRILQVGLSFTFLCLVCLAPEGSADPAVRIVVSNDPCLIMACPGNPPPPTSVQSGVSFELFVAALDAANSRDGMYTGTVFFSSSDSRAVLPTSYTFTPTDGGGKEFTVILNTVGAQTITATDPVRGLAGTLTITVTGSASTPVPVLNDLAKLLLVAALAAAGVWLARAR